MSEKKKLKDYIAEGELKTYKYRLKTVHPLIGKDIDTESILDQLGRSLARFQIASLEGPIQCLLQANPIEFPDLPYAIVYIIDIELRLNCSSYYLQQISRQVFNCSESLVVVRGENEPIQLNNNEVKIRNDINDEVAKRELNTVALLSTDSNYNPEENQNGPGSDYYGDEYNSRFLQYLAHVKKERFDQNKEAPAPLFSWLDMPKPVPSDNDAFNADLEDAPKVYVKPSDKEATDYGQVSVNMNGNFEDVNKKYAKRYYDPITGKPVIITKANNDTI